MISAYVKRRGNLLLLSEYGEHIKAMELSYGIRESLDHLKAGGVFVSFDSACEGELLWAHTIAVYDFYEAVIEGLLDQITAIIVHLSCQNGVVSMRLQIGCRCDVDDAFLRSLSFPLGSLRYDVQESDLTMYLTYSEGGVT